MSAETKTDVLIVGAGPTGLALAAQFIRYGVDFVIIDKKETTTPYSKAIGVHARTLEIYDQIGLADRLIALGAPATKARLIVGGRVRGQVEFGKIGKGLSPYPFVLLVEQGMHESLLHDHIRQHRRDVRWQTELIQFQQNEGRVRAEMTTPAGEASAIEAKFLVGCDGARSFVRNALGLTFSGSTFERMFYVADVRMDWPLAHDGLAVCLMKDSLLVFFPMRGDRQWRIVGTFPEEFAKDEGDVLYEEIEERIKLDSRLELDVTAVNWFSTYKVHTRHVSRFSVGRCFLAGDAAHIHTPAGAQGMNTGIQDGYNLAWKLALLLRGKADLDLINTYNEERLPNAETLMKTTDRFFDLVASPSPLLSFARINVFPYIANAAFRLGAVKRFVFPRISQIAISYRRSSLSSGGDGFAVKAGDRMPWFEVEGASIYDRLREPVFHLIVFYDGLTEIPELPDDLMQRWAGLIDSTVVSLYPQIAEIFGSQRSFYVILRPDNHIGLISADFSTDVVSRYLGKFVS
jgi:2-polyprenyl-6-methoxyphenol hydroxylase-like FAD-dependent oxidoreductase